MRRLSVAKCGFPVERLIFGGGGGDRWSQVMHIEVQLVQIEL